MGNLDKIFDDFAEDIGKKVRENKLTLKKVEKLVNELNNSAANTDAKKAKFKENYINNFNAFKNQFEESKQAMAKLKAIKPQSLLLENETPLADRFILYLAGKKNLNLTSSNLQKHYDGFNKFIGEEIKKGREKLENVETLLSSERLVSTNVEYDDIDTELNTFNDLVADKKIWLEAKDKLTQKINVMDVIKNPQSVLSKAFARYLRDNNVELDINNFYKHYPRFIESTPGILGGKKDRGSIEKAVQDLISEVNSPIVGSDEVVIKKFNEFSKSL